jgi:hypothetical protein
VADITVKASYASVVEDLEEGFLFIGFAQGEEQDEAYVLFRQPLAGGPVWFELGDEAFGAQDALLSVEPAATGLIINIRPEAAQKFGFARQVVVNLSKCEEAGEALAALAEMLGPVWREAQLG